MLAKVHSGYRSSVCFSVPNRCGISGYYVCVNIGLVSLWWLTKHTTTLSPNDTWRRHAIEPISSLLEFYATGGLHRANNVRHRCFIPWLRGFSPRYDCFLTMGFCVSEAAVPSNYFPYGEPLFKSAPLETGNFSLRIHITDFTWAKVPECIPHDVCFPGSNRCRIADRQF